MKVSTVATLLLGAASTVLLAQDPSQGGRDPQHGGVRSNDTQTTAQSAPSKDAGLVTGRVVMFEPGRIIVIRDMASQERTFNLGPGVTLPVDIHVGSFVDLLPEANGANVTKVVVHVDALPATTARKLPNTGTSSTTTTTATTTTTGSWVSGTVTAYTPGQSLTILMPGGTTVEYRIDSSSAIPTDLVIGKVVKIQTDVGGDGTQRLAKQVTYTTKTTTQRKKTTTSMN